MFHLARDTPSRLKSLTSCAHPRSGPNRTSREGNHSDFKEDQRSTIFKFQLYICPPEIIMVPMELIIVIILNTPRETDFWIGSSSWFLQPFDWSWCSVFYHLHRYDAHPAGVVVEQRVGETGLLITALLYVQGISHVVTSNAVWIDPDVPQGQRECLNMPQQRARPCAERLIGILNEHRRAHRRICPRTMRKSNRKISKKKLGVA